MANSLIRQIDQMKLEQILAFLLLKAHSYHKEMSIRPKTFSLYYLIFNKLSYNEIIYYIVFIIATLNELCSLKDQ